VVRLPPGLITTSRRCDHVKGCGAGRRPCSGYGVRNASRVRRAVCREVWSASQGQCALFAADTEGHRHASRPARALLFPIAAVRGPSLAGAHRRRGRAADRDRRRPGPPRRRPRGPDLGQHTSVRRL
jgi:hypothetical protein